MQQSSPLFGFDIIDGFTNAQKMCKYSVAMVYDAVP